MILVTGGAGFLGSNLVAALSERVGAPIYVSDVIDSDSKELNLAKHNITDLIEPTAVLDWLEGEGSKTKMIFHMGATSSTIERDPNILFENNVAFSTSLWRWCTTHNSRMIYASSAATYGNGARGFEDNNDPKAIAALEPLNGYGQSKQLFDIDAIFMSRMGYHPIQWVGLKFFNIYGPNEYHKGNQRSVVAQLYEQISATGRARLFRSHHPDYRNGGQLRDFIWVGDCVEVMLWLYETPRICGIFNCGTGRARSFADLARTCFIAMEREEAIDYFDTPKPLRLHYQYFTEASMNRLLCAGYDRPFTSLEDGVTTYIKDFLLSNDPYR